MAQYVGTRQVRDTVLCPQNAVQLVYSVGLD